MNSTQKANRLLFASTLLVLILLVPTGANGQFGSIFSAILGTITGPIGGALKEINQARAQIIRRSSRSSGRLRSSIRHGTMSRLSRPAIADG